MKIPFSDQTYDQMIASLFVRFPSYGSAGAGAYKPGLKRMKKMLERLGCPQGKFRSIHVAGTNGKGSTCNMIAADLAASGLRTGLYTSPHILDFRERIRVIETDRLRSGRGESEVTLIPREAVWDFIQRHNDDIEDLNLSFFEITTVMAFDWFAACKVDFAVIETGLGGRLDATNVITPELSVITNIGYDHMDLLGPTLADIAGEKAGIIKPGIPVVIGESSPETDGVFVRRAAALNSPITFARQSVSSENANALDLKGIYQTKNLNTVCCALRKMGREPDMGAISRAAAICDFHGRWEAISHNPETICDIGHNEHGLKYNFRQLNDLLDSGTYSDLVMVYGSVRDKDVDAVLRILPDRARLFFAAADNHRAMPAAELFSRAGRLDAVICASVGDAVEKALSCCSSLAKPLLYIGGSTYVVSEALTCIDTAAQHKRNERQ